VVYAAGLKQAWPRSSFFYFALIADINGENVICIRFLVFCGEYIRKIALDQRRVL
jgi:hypothetical protein